MSLDSIVKISIDTQSISMVQQGFGIPLILGIFDHPEDWRVRSFSDTDGLLVGSGEKEKLLRETALFKAAQILCAQKNRVQKFKVGRIKEEDKKDIATSFSKICLDDDDFYGVLFPKASDADAKTLSSLIAQKRMMLGLDVSDTTKAVATDAKDKKNDRVFCIHSPNDEYLAAAWMSKMLAEAPGSASWAFRQLEEVKSYGLTTSKADELEKANINRYIGIKGRGVTLDGKMASGRFIDITHGIDWLHVRIQERLFRLLVVNKKIPYTLKGIDLVRSEILAQLKEGVYLGLLADDPEPQVSTPTIQDIDELSRGNRVLPKVRFNARLSGAIHKIEIQGTVTV